MKKLGTLVVFHPKIIIVATLIITVGLAAAIVARGLSFNGSPETLTRNDDAFRFYNEIKSVFGDDRIVIVALTTDDVFTRDFIAKLDRLTSRLSAITGVAETLSLTNIKAIDRDERGISINKLIPARAIDQGNDQFFDQLKQRATTDPLYARHYISRDGRTAAINVFLKPLDEQEGRAVAEEIERVAKMEADRDEVMLAGVPIMDERGIHYMIRDMLVCSPVAALLCFIVFLAAFRSFWGAVLPMAALVIGLIWTFGLMSLFNRPITFATLSLPTVLMAVGSSYLFHVLNQHRISLSQAGEQSDRAARRAAWLDGFNFISPAVFISGATTMAGFGALASSEVPTVRDMGVFEAAGVGAMLILALGFVPAALALLSPKAAGRAYTEQKDYALWLNKALQNVTAMVLFRRKTVLIVFLVATALIGIGVLRLRVNTDYLRIFPRESETVQSAEKLHERLAGAATVQIIVSGEREAVFDPDFMRAVYGIQQFALDQQGVDAAVSVADIVKRLNGVLDRRSIESEELPKDRARIESIFNDYLSEDESLSRLVSKDHARAVIVLRTHLFGSNELNDLTTKIDKWASANLPANVSARATGSFVLLNDASDAVANSQTSSLIIALVTIYLMMVGLFRSFATGLLALLPNLLPIAGFFGFLGWSGITLDITTSLIATAVLGLAVDNAVHMIRRYRQCAAERRGTPAEDEGWAMWLTMLRTGKPMVLANLMLIAAFLIFLLSSFMPVQTGGLLWAVTLFACLAADLIFLPALMKTKIFARAALGRQYKSGDQSLKQPYASLQKSKRVEYENQ